jgi:hypothetical protein
MPHWIILLTSFFLLIALVTSIAWFIYSPDFEPVITSLALLVTIVSVFAERLVTARERRRELLAALMHELHMNKQVLQDAAFLPDTSPRGIPTIYPRLYTATLETVIASGAFSSPPDRKLFKLLHSWKQRSLEFNRRLDVTELHTFTAPSPELIEGYRRVLTGGKVLKNTKQTYNTLSSHLFENYSKESGVERDTVLFDDSP